MGEGSSPGRGFWSSPEPLRRPGPPTDRVGAGRTSLVEHAWTKRSPHSYAIVFHMGGAVRRVGDMATAFSGRDAERAININAEWLGPDDANEDTAWARGMFEAMRPLATGGVYVNFLGDEALIGFDRRMGPRSMSGWPV